MAFKYFSVLCLLLTINYIGTLELVNGKIKITVGTTSGCGDTVNFISTQLYDAYQEYKDFLEIQFVPWGRTTYDANGLMVCQFGSNDCWANRVHRCALDLLRDNQDAQVFYMNCEFTSPHPAFLQGSYLCALASGISLVQIDYCVNTSGRPLDDAAQALAQQPMATINFVPSIHFNDVIDISVHNQARQRLKSIICFALAADPTTGVTACQI